MPDGMFSSRMKRFTYQNHYGGNPFCKGAEKFQEVRVHEGNSKYVLTT